MAIRDSEPSWPWGKGPLLLRPDLSRAARRRRLIFVVVAVALVGLLVWPLYPRFAILEPKLLGLPFGLVWVLGALAAMFVNFFVLYRGDLRDERQRRRSGEADSD